MLSSLDIALLGFQAQFGVSRSFLMLAHFSAIELIPIEKKKSFIHYIVEEFYLENKQKHLANKW